MRGNRSPARSCRSTTTHRRPHESDGDKHAGRTVMAQTLRERLIGAWTLVSYVEHPVDGSAPFFPMGEEPQGIIMYTPDGYMSAQLMRPGRRPFASGDWFRGSEEEIKEEALGYIAYSGPFQTDEEKQTLTHAMFV